MVRLCYTTTSEAKLITNSDGTYYVEGLGGDAYLASMRVYQRMFKPANVSFFMTTSAEECFARFERNESDTSNLLVPIFSPSQRYEPSNLIITGETQILTGYNIIEGQNREKQTATAIANAYLLDAEVYGWFLFLFFSFITCIALRVVLHWSLRGRSSSLVMVRLICKKVTKVLFSSSGSFRWIEFLFATLMFYMVTSLMCIYKTSQVIVDSPFYPKTYKQSLEHERSVAYFYDQFIGVSATFKDAPIGSMKKKLWDKLVRSGKKDRFRFDFKAPNDQSKLVASVIDTMKDMAENKDILVAASIALPIIRGALLAMTAENELWFIKILTDPSEGEIHYGIAFRRGAVAEFPVKWQRRYYQSQLAAINYMHAGRRAGETLNQLMGTSKRHQARQIIILEDENAFDSGMHVRAIPLNYFASFFAACVIIWAVAFVINFLDCH